MKNIFSKSEISIATGLVKPKTTSLFFDKIWVPDMGNIIFDDKIPKDVLYIHDVCDENYKSYSEEFKKSMNYNMCPQRASWMNITYNYVLPSIENPVQFLEEMGFTRYSKMYSKIPFLSTFYRNECINRFVNDMHEVYNINITPIYLDQLSFENDFFINKTNLIIIIQL